MHYVKISDTTKSLRGGITLRVMTFSDRDGDFDDMIATGLAATYDEMSKTLKVNATIRIDNDGPKGKASQLRPLNREWVKDSYGLQNVERFDVGKLPDGFRWVTSEYLGKEDDDEIEEFIDSLNRRVAWFADRAQTLDSKTVK